MSDKQFSNALSNEKSPYLLQHAHNPVNWLPWGEEAFARAREEEKPIFLSIGYSTCHWCHVMERESFENEEIAEFLNEHFISVKVDREERPDVDSIYMTYVQMRNNGQGGWPMSVWLTPELTPFFGGTYFPPDERYGRAGFRTICRQLADLWRTRRENLLQEGRQVTEAIQKYLDQPAGGAGENHEVPGPEVQRRFIEQCESAFDPQNGGFNGAPKFPRPAVYRLLLELLEAGEVTGDANQDKRLRDVAGQMARRSLSAMAAGGIYDQVGGGFHRYAVDERWHVPHFEKMLYDQGQLVTCYLLGSRLLGRKEFAEIAAETLDYVLRDLAGEDGGFYSAEDADSLPASGATEKVEGAFYTWTWGQLEERLTGGDAGEDDLLHTAARVFGAEKAGNVAPESDPHGELADQNVLFRQLDDEQAAMLLQVDPETITRRTGEIRRSLFDARETRPRPHRDDKVLTAWNGLTISALARAAQALEKPAYLDKARSALAFLQKNLYDEKNDQLLRSWRNGPSEVPAFASDYAFLIDALLEVYHADFDTAHLRWALKLQDRLDNLYWDGKSGGGYLSVTTSRQDNILNMKEIPDGAEPSPNSVAARNLLRLSQLLDKPAYREKLESLLQAQSTLLKENPYAAPELALAAFLARRPPSQAVLCWTGELTAEGRQMLQILRSSSQNHRVLIGLGRSEDRQFFEEHNPAITDMKAVDESATVYLCTNFTCQKPVNRVKDLREQLAVQS